jgi:hypothetical protein
MYDGAAIELAVRNCSETMTQLMAATGLDGVVHVWPV